MTDEPKFIDRAWPTQRPTAKPSLGFHVPRLQLRGHQYKTLSSLSIALAEVMTAGVALPYFLDSYRPTWALFGVAASVASSLAALFFSRP